MFTKKTKYMTNDQVQPTWKRLVFLERLMRRNAVLCRILQPLGTVIFLINMLLVTTNVLLFAGGDLVTEYFSKVPLLPELVASFPRDSWSSLISFSLKFAFLIPLTISLFITLIAVGIDLWRYHAVEERLVGTPAQCAKALVNKAETVYDIRKHMPSWSVFLETGILTAAVALPVIYAAIRLAMGEDSALMQVAIGSFVLLICLFVLFWVYALLFKIFALLNSLFYLSPGKWQLWGLYQRLDVYWESVDPLEFARRDREAQSREEASAWKAWSRKPARPAEEDPIALPEPEIAPLEDFEVVDPISAPPQSFEDFYGQPQFGDLTRGEEE